MKITSILTEQVYVPPLLKEYLDYHENLRFVSMFVKP